MKRTHKKHSQHNKHNKKQKVQSVVYYRYADMQGFLINEVMAIYEVYKINIKVKGMEKGGGGGCY